MARLAFVCWGNICRSPMAERVARKMAQDLSTQRSADASRLAQGTVIESFGISPEELGNPIDRRAARVLAQHGYPVGSHRAKQVDRRLVDASDLVLAFEPLHLDRLRRLVPDAGHLNLVTDFDPAAAKGSGIADPWYGTVDDFIETLAAIEAAMPGIIEAVRGASTPRG